MEASCPNCGAVYDVEASELGQSAICEKCKREFVVGAKANGSSSKGKKTFRVSSRTRFGTKIEMVNVAEQDVHFIAPCFCKILAVNVHAS